MAGVVTLSPTQPHRGRHALAKRRRRIRDRAPVLFQLVPGRLARSEPHLRQAETDRFERKLLGRLPSRGHPLIEAVGEDGPVLVAAVVVATYGHVTAATGDIDLQGVRCVLLQTRAGHADEVRRDVAVAVVTHRVRRIAAHSRDRVIAVPETEGLDPRVDRPQRLGSNLRITSGTTASPRDRAILAHVSAIRSEVVDLGLSHAKVCDRPRAGQPFANGTRDTLDHPVFELDVAEIARNVVLIEELLCAAVGVGCIVLVNASDEHPLLGRPGGFRQLRPPKLVRLVTNLAPIDRHEDNRLARALENKPLREQRIDHRPRHPVGEQRMPLGLRCDIGFEQRHTEFGPGRLAAALRTEGAGHHAGQHIAAGESILRSFVCHGS